MIVHLKPSNITDAQWWLSKHVSEFDTESLNSDRLNTLCDKMLSICNEVEIKEFTYSKYIFKDSSTLTIRENSVEVGK